MYFSTACLMVLEAWHTKERGHVSTDWLAQFAPKTSPLFSSLLTYTSEDVALSGETLSTITPPLPPFWQDKITAAHLLHEDWIDEYTIIQGLFEIEPSSIPALVGTERIALSKAIDELSEKALPTLPGELVEFLTLPKRSISILYLELDETLTASASNSVDIIYLLAEALRYRLRQGGHIILPNFVNGMLLLPSIGYGTPELEAVAVNFRFNQRRFKSGDGSLSLPDTAMQLWTYMACGHIYRHLGDRLGRLPLYEKTATQYLDSLRSDKSNSLVKGTRGQLKSITQLSSAYELKFLEDRQVAMTERLSIKKCVADISKTLRYNVIPKFEKSAPLDVGKSSSYFPYTYGFLASLIGDFMSAASSVEEKEQLIIGREAFLSDYLRDISIAASTRSNLNLQQSIWRLTFVAVLIALVTLLLTVVTIILTLWPDEIKAILAR